MKQIENKFIVNARDLAKSLGIKQDFSSWIKDRIKEHNLKEGIDFSHSLLKVERETGATRRSEYLLTETASALITTHNKKHKESLVEVKKEIIEKAKHYDELSKDPIDLIEYFLSKYKSERALREKAENSLTQLTTQQNHHNTALTTFTQAYDLVKAELAKKYNIRDIKKVKFKREIIINHLLVNSFLVREGSKKRLKATDLGLESGLIDLKVDTSIEGKAFKTPALTSEGVKYILKEFVEDN